MASKKITFLFFCDVINYMNIGQILSFLGWYFNFISADIFVLLIDPEHFVTMWARNSRETKSHAGIIFLEFSVVLGVILNFLAVISFDDFYLRWVMCSWRVIQVFYAFISCQAWKRIYHVLYHNHKTKKTFSVNF